MRGQNSPETKQTKARHKPQDDTPTKHRHRRRGGGAAEEAAATISTGVLLKRSPAIVAGSRRELGLTPRCSQQRLRHGSWVCPHVYTPERGISENAQFRKL